VTLEKIQELKKKGLITGEQFNQIELIVTRKVFSVFYELRTLLYLGVMLFTTGVGFLIYQNIGQLGHILVIISLSILSVGCFVYAFVKGYPFSKLKVESPNPYFDYVLLLGCLLFASVLGYLQFQFNFLEVYPRISSLVTAILFFILAYRFDHLGVLSLAITSLASFFGIVVVFNDLKAFDQLYNVGLMFSVFILVVGIVLERQKIKEHFTFTYLNFGALIFFLSALAGIFQSYRGEYAPYFLALIIGVALSIYTANWKRSFIFLLYGVIAGYIGLTYWLSDNVNWDVKPWLFYMLISCGGFIYFIVKYRNYFKRIE
jgi:hypothetical protein